MFSHNVHDKTVTMNMVERLKSAFFVTAMSARNRSVHFSASFIDRSFIIDVTFLYTAQSHFFWSSLCHYRF